MLTEIKKEKITHTQLVKYAGASGDFNPIHTVVPLAQKAGLKDCIAHGMLVMGMAGEALGKWGVQKDLQLFNVRFSAMTYPGEELVIQGNWTDEEKLKGDLTVSNTEGEVKLKGKFQLRQEEKAE
ncbi:acyl dehydratase [Bacillus ectoiniformans]|uniref:MaoC/PaaZ C-terminal domain-containing protein n=1 Tax=Bacillus ectoiniformans TaxID=1494429 RepID=UPI0019570083|nr:MaoC/PaaZ C-terminal domain-containing protein [Bacillus ectoiniformans]MBM7647713.1 acyl dehydratase [Bacillus ectoiniformans]